MDALDYKRNIRISPRFFKKESKYFDFHAKIEKAIAHIEESPTGRKGAALFRGAVNKAFDIAKQGKGEYSLQDVDAFLDAMKKGCERIPKKNRKKRCKDYINRKKDNIYKWVGIAEPDYQDPSKIIEDIFEPAEPPPAPFETVGFAPTRAGIGGIIGWIVGLGLLTGGIIMLIRWKRT